MAYSFDERLEFSLRVRRLLDLELYPRFSYNEKWVFVGGSHNSIEVQRRDHVDVFVQMAELRSGPYSLLVDEKIDRKTRNTVFCETVSMVEYNKPGWMQPGISRADILLWAFQTKRPGGFKIFAFWLKELQDWFWPRVDTFPEFKILNRQNGKRWTTLGRSVKLNQIPDPVYFINGYQITTQTKMFNKSLVITDPKSSSKRQRQSKIIFISQSHLLPGMNIDRLNDIFAQHNLKDANDWEKISDNEIDDIIKSFNLN